MVEIKNHTSLEQSKMLAEFLPLESADMLFQLGEDKYADSIRVPLTKKHWEQMMPDINPCWSLSALLDVLPTGKVLLHDKSSHGYKCIYKDIDTNLYNNPIDACYEMILKLNESKLL